MIQATSWILHHMIYNYHEQQLKTIKMGIYMLVYMFICTGQLAGIYAHYMLTYMLISTGQLADIYAYERCPYKRSNIADI